MDVETRGSASLFYLNLHKKQESNSIIMEWSIYNYLYYSEKAKKHLLYSSLSNMFIELNDEGYKTIRRIIADPNCEEAKSKQYQFLFDKRFIVESNKVEQEKLVLTSMVRRFSSDTLSLTIAPTQGCNFGCPYCYETNKKNKRMSAKVQDNLVEFVKNNTSLKSLNVIWYGGEPTTALGVVRHLSEELQKTVENYNAFMVTNGYNLNQIVDELEAMKISGLQITLDGTKQTHDATRFLLNGKSTFDRILSNIELLLEKNEKVSVSIRMNISNDNSSEYEPLYELLRTRFNNSKQVHLYPAFVEDYTGCQLGNCFENGESKAIFLKNLYYERGIETSNLYPKRTGKGCMRQTLNAFVVGPEGNLYKCWHHLGSKDKIVGNIMKENVISNYGLLSDMMLFNDVLFDEKCKNCVLFPSCDGGCSDIKDKTNDVCIPAKTMLGDFLDIKYLQWKKNVGNEKD